MAPVVGRGGCGTLAGNQVSQPLNDLKADSLAPWVTVGLISTDVTRHSSNVL